MADDKNEGKKELSDFEKSGFDFNERLTLKHNTLEAEKYRERKNQKQQHAPLQPTKKPKLPNQMSIKIKDAFDEDDEDENEGVFYQPIRARAEENPLYNALDENEKRLFMQKQTIHTTEMQQKAGKMEALMLANMLAKKAGLSKISAKTLGKGVNQAVFDPKKLNSEAVRGNVGKKFKMKGKLENGKIIEAAKGIKKIEQMAGEQGLRDISMNEAVAIGENKMGDRKIAELILEKSGQKLKKIKTEKASEEQQLEPFEETEQKQKISLLKQKNDKLDR